MTTVKEFLEKELIPFLHTCKFTATNRQFKKIDNLISSCKQIAEQQDKDATIYMDPTTYEWLIQGMYRGNTVEIPICLTQTERFSLELKGNYNVSAAKEKS